MTSAEPVPLRRLLEREAIARLLEAFAALAPGGDWAVVDAEGRVFVGPNSWPRAALQAALALARDGQPAHTLAFHLYPLLAGTQLMGALVAHDPTLESGLLALHHSLTLLIAQALEKRDLAHETLERYREINLLYRVGETIGACLDPEEIPQLELAEASHVIPSDVSAVLLPTRENAGPLEVRASLGAPADVAALCDISQTLVAQVRQTSRPDIFIQIPGDPSELSMVLCAPLVARERVLGVVLLGRRADRPLFTAGDEKLVLALSSQAALALEKARLHQQEIQQQRLEEELAVGKRIQLGLLPAACPIVPGWEFAAHYQAARQIGGDFYDFFSLPGAPPRWGLVIADVTGKGVPAALMMAFSRAILRTEGGRGHSPASVLAQANQLILEDNRSRLFVSAFYATLDTQTGRLSYASGGHDYPLWLQARTGECQALKARGVVLGAFETSLFEEGVVDLAPGDALVLYTDGVTEAMNADGQLFDEPRLRSVVMAHPSASAEELLRAIVQAVKEFVGDTPASDDLTMVVIKRID